LCAQLTRDMFAIAKFLVKAVWVFLTELVQRVLYKFRASSWEVYRHAEGLHPQRNFFADSAKSNDRQRFSVEFST